MHPLLFSGTANRPLAEAVARALGRSLDRCSVLRFPDGELAVQLEEPVRHRHAVLVQSTSPPVNDHLVELLAFVDALRRGGASGVTAALPYFGYARQDRRHSAREPITARMVATLLESVGVDQVVVIDLHTAQLEGFFHVPVDVLSAVPTLCDALRPGLPEDVVVVSPDAGRVSLAAEYARRLERPMGILHKERLAGARTRVTHRTGEVHGRTCLLIDDMISTGGTLVESAAALREAGARSLMAAATHGLLLEDAAERLVGAGFHKIVVSDTICQPAPHPRVEIASVAPLLAGALRAAAPGL